LIEQQDALVGINRDNRIFGDKQDTLEPRFAATQCLFCAPTFDRDRRQVCYLFDKV